MNDIFRIVAPAIGKAIAACASGIFVAAATEPLLVAAIVGGGLVVCGALLATGIAAAMSPKDV